MMVVERKIVVRTMCELFAMSSRVPVNVRFSLETFARRGGLEGPHKDGWGLAYYRDGDVQRIRDPEPAADSACIRFLQEHPFVSSAVVGHIRRATQGSHGLRNCQPFTRELGGAMHVFAHNGDLDAARLRTRLTVGAYRPVGDTDSEYAFCALLEDLRLAWNAEGGRPPLATRLAIVAGFAATIRALGPANFIYTDGDALFAHGHRRMHGSEGPRPPGLHVLCRHCTQATASFEAEGLSIHSTPVEQDVVLFASVPLTTEPGWQPLAEGEVVVAHAGRIAARAPIHW